MVRTVMRRLMIPAILQHPVMGCWQSRSFTGCNTSQGAPVSQLTGFRQVSPMEEYSSLESLRDSNGIRIIAFFKANLGFAPSSPVSIPVTAMTLMLALSPHLN